MLNVIGSGRKLVLGVGCNFFFVVEIHLLTRCVRLNNYD